MLLPALLPTEFSFCALADSEEHLFGMLKEHPHKFVAFFENAVEDETWSALNKNFIRLSLAWFSEHFLHRGLSFDLAKRVVTAYQYHAPILRPFLPEDIVITVQKHEYKLNSLQFGTASYRLLDILHSHPTAEKTVHIELKHIPHEIFAKIAEFITFGTLETLWRENDTFILSLLKEASRLELDGIVAIAADILKRYINRDNMIDILLLAHSSGWQELKSSAFEYLNQLSKGFRISTVERKRIDASQQEIVPLAFEFLDFSDDALDFFSKLRSEITHLIVSGYQTGNPNFSIVVKECPKLISLDITRSETWSERLLDIDPALQELDISKCSWLTDVHLAKILETCPNLSRLAVSGDARLSFKSWGELQKLAKLISLDISRCNQITDEDFTLILKACPQLIELNVEECKKITNKGFFALGQYTKKLTHLNVSRCILTDAAVIDIAHRCEELLNLNIVRCPSISEKGILQTLAHAPVLKELYFSDTDLSEESKEKIRFAYPYLVLRPI